ncbi:MAG: sulfite exporter TauE/SafE family protein [Cellvibrionales bacterium]|jgi:uncharacterized membrane protein YfcA|nr:sulfite exporter TauE/SafE family protein [Cellvibrionales bacterium]
MDWLLFLIVGAFAGLLAGLFGVGGGAIIVPILILIFSQQGFEAGLLTHLAIGTSFAIIVVTSFGSVSAHHRLGNVNWLVVKSMAPGLIVGVVLGAVIATELAGRHLQLAIAVFLMLVAVQMFFALQPRALFGLPRRSVLVSSGVVIGGASAFFGIGGGSLTVPFLAACNQVMKRAVATSSACGFPIAVFGALAYGVKGLSVSGLPSLATGYIYWPAFVGVAIASIPFTRMGAMLAERVADKILKRSFALLLFLIGLQLLLTH